MKKKPPYETNVARRARVAKGNDRIVELQRHMDAIQFARELVVKAAMDTFHKGYIDNTLCILHKACTALDEAEKSAAGTM